MKRLIATLAAASFLAYLPTVPAQAVADPPGASLDGIVERCKSSIDAFPEEPLGNCMAIRTTVTIGANGAIPNICNFFESSRPEIFYYYYETFEDCVHDRASFGS